MRESPRAAILLVSIIAATKKAGTVHLVRGSDILLIRRHGQLIAAFVFRVAAVAGDTVILDAMPL